MKTEYIDEFVQGAKKLREAGCKKPVKTRKKINKTTKGGGGSYKKSIDGISASIKRFLDVEKNSNSCVENFKDLGFATHSDYVETLDIAQGLLERMLKKINQL